MEMSKLQQLSIRTFAALGRLVSRLKAWIIRHPQLAKWVYPPVKKGDVDDYAAENRHVFSLYQ